MMMSKRRCSGWRATYVAGSLIILFVSANPAVGGIISDRSAFVGDFTVIDFETLGDGTPLILDEGEIFGMFPQEYAAFGVTITSSGNIFGTDAPFIANDREPQVDAAQQVAGSLTNLLTAGARDAFLRLDFSPSVDAIGVATLVRPDGSPVILEVFDVSGNLLDRVVFQGDLIDGVVRGADFGNDYDVAFGFLGYSSPDTQIGYAILSEDLASFDDLHFGAIPEPSSACLFCCVFVLIVLRRKKRHALFPLVRAIPLLLAILSAPIALRAETITGTVTGYVMTSEYPICGDNGPNAPEDWCDQQPLEQVPLHGVRVCDSGLSCTFTDEQGDYELTVNDPVPVNIAADLDGPTIKVPGDTSLTNTKGAEL